MDKYIVVTGAAGFIGSNLVERLNKNGLSNIILSDKFDTEAKEKNIEPLHYAQKIDRDAFVEWFSENSDKVSLVFHLGARTDTAEFNFRVLDSLNLSYSKNLWEICTAKQIPFIYASSAATYGLGENGFNDDHDSIEKLKPLNPYGVSKQLFDMFVLKEKKTPPFWCGMKFFNVYGPHEYHKGRMASVVFHAFNQIKATQKVRLFRSHREDFKNGEQLRDFIYVEDVVDICMFFMNNVSSSDLCGIYNVGTGTARSFNDLALALFKALHLSPDISYIDIPSDIRHKYQYFTEAQMSKLQTNGYIKTPTSLEDGVKKYVDFLIRNS